MAESVMSEGKPVVVSKCLNSNSSCSKSSDTIWLMPPLSVHTKMRCLLSSVTNIVALLLRLVLRCALRVCNLKVICLIVVIVGITVFGVMEVLIIKDMRAVADSDREYVIVLGAQVRGTRITKSLRKRLDTALDYLEEHPDANVVCSGGQGRGEDLSEAEAMKNYLMEHGIAEKRIITEDKSRTTYENLKFTQQLIDKDAKIAIVTNNFHVHRAVHLAKTLGYQNVQGMAAPSDNHLLPNYMVREAIALFKEYLVR